jgi:ribosomal protein S18 acetylase RimI-like enzyme
MMQRVSISDVPVLQKLIQKEFPYIKKPKEQLESRIQNPLFFLFKIENGKKLAGFCEIEVLEENKIARLNALAVLPECRKKGLGNQLLQAVLRFLQERGFETIGLLVKSKNKIARSLYEKNGFAWIQTLPKPIDNATVEEYKLELQKKALSGVA